MPYRVPEGPVDPYEPFPLAGPQHGSWTPAPIVRGRDLGRPAPASAAASQEGGSGEAYFVDIAEAGVRVPAETLVSFEEPLESPHAGDGAEDLGRIAAFGLGGDGFESWAVVDSSPPDLPPAGQADPWALVDVADAVYSVQEPDSSLPPALEGAPAHIYPSPAEESTNAANRGIYTTRPAAVPPLSSRAVLIIGVLALLCLTLAAALAFQALGGDVEPPAIDAPAGDEAGYGAAQSAIGRNAMWTSSLPVSDTTLTAIERAAVGPLETELDRLGSALQGAFGRSSAEVAPVLRPYVAHAAERMATHPLRFRLVVEAPNVELAVTRAEAIVRAFQGAGMPADKLTMTAAAGMPAVRFES